MIYKFEIEQIFPVVTTVNAHLMLLIVLCLIRFLQKALDDLDFNGEEIHDILKVISAILKLGNLNFIPTTNMDGTEGCAISNDYGKPYFNEL